MIVFMDFKSHEIIFEFLNVEKNPRHKSIDFDNLLEFTDGRFGITSIHS